MRKFVPAILGAIVLAAPLHAQASVGILGGFVSSNITNNNTDGTFSSSSRSGFAAGVSVDGMLAPSVALGADAMYVTKGAKLSGGSAVGSLELGYIDVPVRFKLMFGRSDTKLFILGGGYIGFKVQCTNHFDIGSAGNSDCGSTEDNGIKSTDFGATFGAGVMIRRLSISARYDLGLTDISSGANASDPSFRNHTFLVLAGLHFRTHHMSSGM